MPPFQRRYPPSQTRKTPSQSRNPSAQRRLLSSRGGHIQSDWYKDAIIYELRVRSFYDSNADGIGDLPGLIDRLDYLEYLGVNTLWLLPFYKSALGDDGYDISDYMSVHPECGTLNDFKTFLREAHARGMRVIIELVLNHTSDQHPWFQRARRSPKGSRQRDFYVWSDTPDRFCEARVIFKDFETSNWAWDPVAGAWYWHRFYAHQPDLNFDSHDVRKALFGVVDFWLAMGVDGLRLDAVPYLYEREGTSCENLPETHAFLRELRKHVDAKFPGRMLLAEANQWPEEAAEYLGSGAGDECHMAFHFPIMPRIFMAVRMEDRFALVDILSQTPPIPSGAQWALFLRNHDELTLEMVTDEERDFMYRMYAKDPRARINLGIRRRLAPLLGNNRRAIELVNGLLFSLPGTPVVYYGDEIGMGDTIYLGDRNGVRTPMQWSSDRNAGFSRANPQQLFLPVITDPEYSYQTVNVETEGHNENSLLNWTRQLIALRKAHPVLGRGDMRPLFPKNPRVFVFLRNSEEETLLVVCNLARTTQHVELDLSEFAGLIPVELFGGTALPTIGRAPYFLLLAPHQFHWFSLKQEEALLRDDDMTARGRDIPDIDMEGDWLSLSLAPNREALESVLPQFLRRQRWFGHRTGPLSDVRFRAPFHLHIGVGREPVLMGFLNIRGEPEERWLLPLAVAQGERAERIERERPESVLARLGVRRAQGPQTRQILYDAFDNPDFALELMRMIAEQRKLRGQAERIAGVHAKGRRRAELMVKGVRRVFGEQSNTSLVFDDRFILKVFRRLLAGPNPDLEIGQLLAQRGFAQTPKLVGHIEHRLGDRAPAATMGVLHEFLPNEGTAFEEAVCAAGRFFERLSGGGAQRIALEQDEAALDQSGRIGPLPRMAEQTRALLHVESLGEVGFWAASRQPPPEPVVQAMGGYLDCARRLGEVTAKLHQTLAAEQDDPAFKPQPFGPTAARALYQGLQGHLFATMQRVSAQVDRPSGTLAELKPEVDRLIAAQPRLVELLSRLRAMTLTGSRIRIHGDFHLGQVLRHGDELSIVDFEGEPSRSLSERRLKRSALRDVAGMIRSFHYAAYAPLLSLQNAETRAIAEEEQRGSMAMAQLFARFSSAAFLRGYLERARAEPFLPSSEEEGEVLLTAFVIGKGLYEIDYELGHRPRWLPLALRGFLGMFGLTEAPPPVD